MAKGAASVGSVEEITSTYPAPRKAQNLDSVKGVKNASAEPSEHTILEARHNLQAGDPAIMPHGPRTYAPKERNGAAYGVRVAFQAHTAPEAGATLANGRVFPAAVNRSAPNFAAGIEDHN